MRVKNYHTSARFLTFSRYSDTLYSGAAHFLLELIQNADDNEYDTSDTPSLVIVYRGDGYLWFGCNEIGFTEENVRSICQMGASTKVNKTSDKHYIGEKGIGFKSVFKAADFVWIRSEPYEFSFDRNQVLGPIMPEWRDFKSHEKMESCKTAFCLRIPDHERGRVIRNTVCGLEAQLLLFLQKIQKIDVHVEHSSGLLERHFELSWDKGSKVLEKRGYDLSPLQERGVQLKVVTCHPKHPPGRRKIRRFLVKEHKVLDMPHDNLRADITTTLVALAFPIQDLESAGLIKPSHSRCHTFSFLPVRDYGLPVSNSGRAVACVLIIEIVFTAR